MQRKDHPKSPRRPPWIDLRTIKIIKLKTEELNPYFRHTCRNSRYLFFKLHKI